MFPMSEYSSSKLMASLSWAPVSGLRCGARGCMGSEDTERVEVFS